MTNILKIRGLKAELSKNSPIDEVNKTIDSIRHRWTSMKQRCYNIKCKSYKNYGGRGITICEEWLNDSFVFILWSLKNGYKEGLQVDREDNNGNYTPENCRYITPRENNKTKRNITPIKLVYEIKEGIYKDKSTIKVSKLLGVPKSTVWEIRVKDYTEELNKFKTTLK